METNYTIQMCSQLSGVGVHTIRAWEKRYRAIVPKRDALGHRLYSHEDILKLKLLNDICQLGFAISKVAGLSLDELKIQLKNLGKSSTEVDEMNFSLYQRSLENVDYRESLTILLMALKAYKIDIVSKELEKLRGLMNARDFALDIILPLMTELGVAVESELYSISHEHALSSILKFHSFGILYQQNEIPSHYPKVAIAGLEGDLHEFGVLVAAMICHHYQFNVIYLGPNLPCESLVDVINSLEVDFAIVGVTSVMEKGHDIEIKKYLSALVLKSHPKCKIILGAAKLVPLKMTKNLIQLRTLHDLDDYLQNHMPGAY